MKEYTHVLLCAPQHYDVKYAINPWMMGGNAVDECKAREQFDTLVDTYEASGLKPVVIDQDRNLPDMVFTANAGVLLDGTFVPSNFRYPERTAESAHFAGFFSAVGKTILKLDDTTIFEGAGDALRVGDSFIVASGFRSSPAAATELATHFPTEHIVSVGLSNPYYYHLDTCLSPLPSGRFIYFPDAFDDLSRKKLEAIGGYWVTERFCVQYGCNMVAHGDVAITSYIDDRMRQIAAKEDLKLIELDMSEFVKAGGGVRCLSFLYS